MATPSLNAQQLAWIKAASPKPAAAVSLNPQQVAWIQAASGNKPPVAAAVRPPVPLGLPAAQNTAFGQLRQGVNEGYKSGIVQNDYQRGVTQAGYASANGDALRQFAEMRNHAPDQYNGRGLLHSGIYKQGLQDMLQNRLRDVASTQQQQSGVLGGFDVARQQLESQRAQALAQIEAQRQLALGQYAAGSIG